MKKQLLLILFFFYAIAFTTYSQANKIDSLKTIIPKQKQDTLLANIYNKVAKEYEFINQDSSHYYISKAIKLSLKLNYLNGLGTSYMYRGYLAEDVSEFDSAIANYSKAYAIFEKLGDKASLAEQLKLIGEATRYKGNLPEALKYFQQALTIYEQIQSKDGIAGLKYSMGSLYKDMGLLDKAMEFYQASLKINKELNLPIGIANLTTAVGIIHNHNQNFTEAKKNYLEAKKIYESLNYDNGLSNLYTWMAITAYHERDFKKALEYFILSHDIYKKINSTSGLMYVYDNIGNVYTAIGDYTKAIEWQQKSLDLALKMKSLDNIRYAYEMLANTYAKKGEYQKAYEHHVTFVKYKDSLLSENTAKQLSELDKKYESEKKDKEILIKDAEILKQISKIEKHNTERNYFILGFIIMAIISIFIYRSYKQKQKANTIIESQKKEVEFQKMLLETKQKEIIDSIHYAKRIQNSLLPNEKYIQRVLEKKQK